jgi:hypothetical protein
MARRIEESISRATFIFTGDLMAISSSDIELKEKHSFYERRARATPDFRPRLQIRGRSLDRRDEFEMAALGTARSDRAGTKTSLPFLDSIAEKDRAEPNLFHSVEWIAAMIRCASNIAEASSSRTSSWPRNRNDILCRFASLVKMNPIPFMRSGAPRDAKSDIAKRSSRF